MSKISDIFGAMLTTFSSWQASHQASNMTLQWEYRLLFGLEKAKVTLRIETLDKEPVISLSEIELWHDNIPTYQGTYDRQLPCLLN